MSEPWKQHLKNKIEGMRVLKNELALKVGLVMHTKSADTVHAEHNQDFLNALLDINHELEVCYKRVRELPVHSHEEAHTLEHIRALEDQRFQLLGHLNGQQIEAYNILPVAMNGDT